MVRHTHGTELAKHYVANEPLVLKSARPYTLVIMSADDFL